MGNFGTRCPNNVLWGISAATSFDTGVQKTPTPVTRHRSPFHHILDEVVLPEPPVPVDPPARAVTPRPSPPASVSGESHLTCASIVDLEEILDSWPVLRGSALYHTGAPHLSLAMFLSRLSATMTGLTSTTSGLVETQSQVMNLRADLAAGRADISTWQSLISTSRLLIPVRASYLVLLQMMWTWIRPSSPAGAVFD